MVQLLDVGFAASSKGQVGDFEAFLSPVLESGGIEVGILGRDDHARFLGGVVPAELHPG